jgi:hypothetical protein
MSKLQAMSLTWWGLAGLLMPFFLGRGHFLPELISAIKDRCQKLRFIRWTHKWRRGPRKNWKQIFSLSLSPDCKRSEKYRLRLSPLLIRDDDKLELFQE